MHSGDYQYRYVGLTTFDIESRFGGHKRLALKGSLTPVHVWMREYGKRVRIDVLEEITTNHDDLLRAEMKWIAVLDTFHSGLNCNAGGNTRYNLNPGPRRCFTDEHKARISEALKNRKFSVEHRKKISDYAKNRITNEETRKKVSDTLKGRVFSDEHRRKLSESGKNRVVSQETRDKISQSNRGRKAVFSDTHRKNLSIAGKGKIVSDETKKKMSDAQKRAIESGRRVSRKGIPKSNSTKQKMRETQLKRFKCNECDYVSSPQALGAHHRKISHSGRTLVS